MFVNGISARSVNQSGDSLEVVLSCDISDALAMDDSVLTVTTDEGSVTNVFSGYQRSSTSIDSSTGYVTVSYRIDRSGMGESLSHIASAVESAYQAASSANDKAEEAKQAAGHADPQLAALAKLQVATMDLSEATCDEVVAFRDYWPEWQPDTAYKHNQPLTYQGRYFRTSKDLTSQAIYPPGTAESEYYEVTLAPDGIIVWYTVGGEYNMVYKGERRHYPDADGPVYVSKRDGNTSEPGTDQWWTLEE